MIHLMIFLSLITAQSSVGADIEERMANETVIVSPQTPILNQSETESGIVVENHYSNPVPLWVDDDIVIDSAYGYQAISVATRRSTGEIYVVASRFDSAGTHGKLVIWNSPDGTNWSQLLTMSSNYGSLLNPSLNIFTTADSEYMIVAFEQEDSGPQNVNVRAYRRALGAAEGRFSDISAYPSSVEKDPDLCNSDLQYPNNPWLFCAFECNDSIGFARSTDYGLTWTSRQIIGAGGTTWDYRDPDCAFGWFSSSDSMFIGVAWEYASTDGGRHLRFRKNTVNGTPGYWHTIEYFGSPANTFDDYPALQMTHGNYPSAVIMFQRKDTLGADNVDLYKQVTNDGAENWSEEVQFNSTTVSRKPFGLGIDDALGYYHLVFRNQNGALPYQKARYDSTLNSWSPDFIVSSGNGWSEGDFPAVGVRNNIPYVCWVDWHVTVYKLKFDAEWLQTGIGEQKSLRPMSSMIITPNPSSGKMKISYQVRQPGNNKISLYNASGRLVDNLVYNNVTIGEHTIPLNCRNLPAGVYFVSVEMPDGISRQRVTIAK